MRSTELTTGRTFGVIRDPGEDFFPTLSRFWHPAGLHPDVPGGVRRSRNRRRLREAGRPGRAGLVQGVPDDAEAMGCGTIAYDAERDEILPHIHTTLGEKARGATGYTRHLLFASV